MKYNDSVFTPTQLAKLTGYTYRHIVKMIETGKLSATKEDGHYYIDRAEYYRVFPDGIKKVKRMQKVQDELSKKEGNQSVLLEIELRHLKEILAEKNKTTQFLMEQINTINEEKSKMIEAITSQTRLLEHKEKQIQQSRWRNLFKRKG